MKIHGYDNSRKLEYKVDDKHLTIYEIDSDGKRFERYYIEKNRCISIDDQLDWVLHMSEKNWINGYDFKKEFIKALKQWNLVNTENRKGKVNNGTI
tara:strand:+ start:16 stop:303 length:288 start_codon:yes stop_codon:yes gene_type:complete